MKNKTYRCTNVQQRIEAIVGKKKLQSQKRGVTFREKNPRFGLQIHKKKLELYSPKFARKKEIV